MEHPKDMRVAFEAFGCVERQQLVVIPASDSESICYLNGIYVYAHSSSQLNLCFLYFKKISLVCEIAMDGSIFILMYI